MTDNSSIKFLLEDEKGNSLDITDNVMAHSLASMEGNLISSLPVPQGELMDDDFDMEGDDF